MTARLIQWPASAEVILPAPPVADTNMVVSLQAEVRLKPRNMNTNLLNHGHSWQVYRTDDVVVYLAMSPMHVLAMQSE